MKRVKYLSLLVLVSLVLAPAVNAQTSTGATAAAAASTATSFDQLSTGNQMIARSLMDAQTTPANGGQIWTLDQIAAAKSGTGWGNVFATMKADGLLNAENLGQVVSAYARSTHEPVTQSVVAEAGMESSESTAAGTETETESTNAAGTAESGAKAGAFAALSPGDQKIARALMDAQTVPASGTAQLWTLDQIAAAKSGTGWGQVFEQMHSEGLINAANLGQVVSGYETGGTVAASETATTASNASTTAAANLLEHGNESHGQSGEAGAQGSAMSEGSTASEAGLTTATNHAADMGDAGISTAESEMANPGADASISASDSVTTGAGLSVGLSHAAMAPGVAMGNGVAASLTGGADASIGGSLGVGVGMSQVHGAGHGH